MAVTSELSGAGFRHLRMFALGTNGLPLASVAGATAYSGVQITLAKAFTPTFPESNVIQITGDDNPAGQIILPATESVQAEIRTGKSNLTVDALLSGLSVVTEGDQKFMLRESNLRGCEALVGILGYQQAIDNDPDSSDRGATKWRAMWMPKARVVAYGAPMEEGAGLESRYMAYAQVVNAHIWGMLFATGIEGASEAQLVEHFLNGPPALDTWLIDSTPTLTLNLSGTAKANEAGDDFDINVYRWNNSTEAVTDITSACTLGASSITVVGPVEDDMVMAVYSQSASCGAA